MAFLFCCGIRLGSLAQLSAWNFPLWKMQHYWQTSWHVCLIIVVLRTTWDLLFRGSNPSFSCWSFSEDEAPTEAGVGLTAVFFFLCGPLARRQMVAVSWKGGTQPRISRCQYCFCTQVNLEAQLLQTIWIPNFFSNRAGPEISKDLTKISSFSLQLCERVVWDSNVVLLTACHCSVV